MDSNDKFKSYSNYPRCELVLDPNNGTHQIMLMGFVEREWECDTPPFLVMWDSQDLDQSNDTRKVKTFLRLVVEGTKK